MCITDLPCYQLWMIVGQNQGLMSQLQLIGLEYLHLFIYLLMSYTFGLIFASFHYLFHRF